MMVLGGGWCGSYFLSYQVSAAAFSGALEGTAGLSPRMEMTLAVLDGRMDAATGIEPRLIGGSDLNT